MASKQKTTNPIVELLLCIFLGYFGAHRFYAGKTKSAWLYLFTVGLCGIGWLVDIFLIAFRIAKPLLSKTTHNATPQKYSGVVELAYHYDDVKFYPPLDVVDALDKSILKPHTDLDLIPEPSNEYDPGAVALYIGNHKIGYLLRGTIQDMTRDYIVRGWPIKAKLVSLKKVAGEYQGYIDLSYYRPVDR